jgi:beta-phosphoglucomutase family hydrolase
MPGIEKITAAWNIQAVIFDLDGTMINNNAFHLASWQQYLTAAGIEIGEKEYRANINGRTNKDAIEYIYQRKMTDEEAMVYALEKEMLYRKLYEPFIKPVDGLLELLGILEKHQFPLGIATSGIQVNIDFFFKHIPIQQFFSAVISSAHITKGKPDPEIFLKTAATLGVSPDRCLVFEDAAVGVSAAKKAGMKVIALTTTQTTPELFEANLIIKDFTDLLS